jgi:NADH-quinone oxidoreductase subunit M
MGDPSMQAVVKLPWIEAFGIEYLLGVDGISLPLVVLTTFLSMLAAAASWPISKHVKAYSVLFLLLVTGMLGVFNTFLSMPAAASASSSCCSCSGGGTANHA